jgi:hypothetical protein
VKITEQFRRKKWIPTFAALVFVAVTVSLLVWLSRSSEPRYQGRPIGVWWDDWYPAHSNQVARAQTPEELNTMVQSLGTKALPTYLKWIDYQPPRSWYSNFSSWLGRKSSGRVRLPQPKDRSVPAYACIKALGPAAAPLIPDLTRVALEGYRPAQAVACLAAIGPTAIPALSNVVALNTSRSATWLALWWLGNFGTNARSVAPLLHRLANDPSANALIVRHGLHALAEIEPDWSAVGPLLLAKLEQTDGFSGAASGAATGLARLKPHSVPGLLKAVTNAHQPIRIAAAAALRVELLPNSQFRFAQLHADFARMHWSIESSFKAGPEYVEMQRVLRPYLTDTNAEIRIAATNALAYFNRNNSQTNHSPEEPRP